MAILTQLTDNYDIYLFLLYTKEERVPAVLVGLVFLLFVAAFFLKEESPVYSVII